MRRWAPVFVIWSRSNLPMGADPTWRPLPSPSFAGVNSRHLCTSETPDDDKEKWYVPTMDDGAGRDAVDAAMRLMAEQGFDATSMAQIADATGIPADEVV